MEKVDWIPAYAGMTNRRFDSVSGTEWSKMFVIADGGPFDYAEALLPRLTPLVFLLPCGAELFFSPFVKCGESLDHSERVW